MGLLQLGPAGEAVIWEFACPELAEVRVAWLGQLFES